MDNESVLLTGGPEAHPGQAYPCFEQKDENGVLLLASSMLRPTWPRQSNAPATGLQCRSRNLVDTLRSISSLLSGYTRWELFCFNTRADIRSARINRPTHQASSYGNGKREREREEARSESSLQSWEADDSQQFYRFETLILDMSCAPVPPFFLTSVSS